MLRNQWLVRLKKGSDLEEKPKLPSHHNGSLQVSELKWNFENDIAYNQFRQYMNS